LLIIEHDIDFGCYLIVFYAIIITMKKEMQKKKEKVDFIGIGPEVQETLFGQNAAVLGWQFTFLDYNQVSCFLSYLSVWQGY